MVPIAKSCTDRTQAEVEEKEEEGKRVKVDIRQIS
jgi:hypothetical protein